MLYYLKNLNDLREIERSILHLKKKRFVIFNCIYNTILFKITNNMKVYIP
jgi:hypothetical protein